LALSPAVGGSAGKSAPARLRARPEARAGIPAGISAGIPAGISAGISGGARAGISAEAPADAPSGAHAGTRPPLRPTTGFAATRRRIWAHRQYYLLLLPAFAYVCIFNYAPLYGLQIAFKDFYGSLGIWGSPWVGLKNFNDFFSGFYFWRTLSNTVIISVYSLVVKFPLPIILALMINELKRGRYKKFVQTALYAPHFISVVVMVGILHTMLSPSIGVVNTVLEALGHERVYFMALPNLFRGIYVLSDAWQEMGWTAVIYIAALSGVDPELHESARIDGASRLQRIVHINLPCISVTIVLMLILSVGNLVNVGYEKIYLMQNMVNTEVSEVINTLVYKRGIVNNKLSFSAAVGFFNNAVNLILLFAANFVAGRLSKESLF
jgi:putative aldouronate transport system permease protein